MAIIRDRRLRDDDWRPAPEGTPPAGGAFVVPLARFLSEREALRASGARVGVRLEPTDPVEPLAGNLDGVEMIAIHFGGFTEGRGYTQARMLRERLGYRGELRAVGDVSRDRLAFMARCGFDAFALREGQDPTAALAAFDEVSVNFQPGADGADFAARRRGWRRVPSPPSGIAG